MSFLDKFLRRNQDTFNNSIPVEDAPLQFDPIESDPEFKSILEAVEAEAHAEIEAELGLPRQLGYCHIFWAKKERSSKRSMTSIGSRLLS